MPTDTKNTEDRDPFEVFVWLKGRNLVDGAICLRWLDRLTTHVMHLSQA